MKFTFAAERRHRRSSRARSSMNRFDFNVGEGWNDTSWVAQDVTVDVKLDLKQ